MQATYLQNSVGFGVIWKLKNENKKQKKQTKNHEEYRKVSPILEYTIFFPTSHQTSNITCKILKHVEPFMGSTWM